MKRASIVFGFLFLLPSYVFASGLVPAMMPSASNRFLNAEITHIINENTVIDLCIPVYTAQLNQPSAFSVGTAKLIESKEGQCYQIKNGRLETVSRKNCVESFVESGKKLVLDNPWFQTISWLGCVRSVGCLVYALGTPALTMKYLGWQLSMGFISSAVAKASSQMKAGEYVSCACLSGALVGRLSRYN